MRPPIKVHPACDASPEMSPECYEAFKADIEKNGLIQPIVIHKGMILDGRHWQRACDDLRIEADYIENDDLRETNGDPWSYVYSMMMHKEITDSQLSMFAAEWQKVLKPEAKKRQRKHGGTAPGRKRNTGGTIATSDNGKSRDKAAKKYGISGRTVSKGAKVIDKGCKQLREAVRSGRVNVSLAEKVVNSMEGDAQQEAVAVAMVSEKPEKALREAVKPERFKPEHPHPASESFMNTLASIVDQFLSIKQEYGSIKAMLSSEKWGKQETKVACDLVNDLVKELASIQKEFQKHECILAPSKTVVKSAAKAKTAKKPGKLVDITCSICGEIFTPLRKDCKYCGPDCRAKAKAQRKAKARRIKAEKEVSKPRVAAKKGE
jgi:transposase